jgi:hypothetical protein
MFTPFIFMVLHIVYLSFLMPIYIYPLHFFPYVTFIPPYSLAILQAHHLRFIPEGVDHLRSLKRDVLLKLFRYEKRCRRE